MAINHVQATVGMKSCAVPRAAFLSSATPPQALKHRANIWQGRLECWPLGWGAWWALDPRRGLCYPAQYELSPVGFSVSMILSFEQWRIWWLYHGAELLLWQPALTLPMNPSPAPSKEGIPENSSSIALCCQGEAEEDGLEAQKCHYFVFPLAKGAPKGQVDIASGGQSPGSRTC